MPFSVYLVDDHAAFRLCLRGLLAAAPDLQVHGEADGATALLDTARALAPQPVADVVLMDVALGADSGISLTRALLQLAPRTRVLALSLHDDPLLVRAMADAGAAGYLRKDDPLPRLLQALRTVAAGGQAFVAP